MKLRVLSAAVSALFVTGLALATTIGFSIPVTGAANSATTAFADGMATNFLLEVVGVIPVVSTVTGNPASMAASVNVGTGLYGCSFTGCSPEMWVGQWNIISTASGIQAVSSYQGSTVRLINTSGAPMFFSYRCQVGQMTGSCFFVIRKQPVSDPLF